MVLQTGILKMFAASPIRPIQQHMAKAFECASLLEPFFKAILDESWEKAKALRLKITEAEHSADTIKMDLRMHLPKSLLLPVPRSDILDLITKQDTIANLAKDISGIVIGRHMKFPENLRINLENYIKHSILATKLAKDAIDELDELMEYGFKGKEVPIVEKMLSELNTVEHETDKLQINLRQQLFDIEKELSPVDVIFLYRIIEAIGGLADNAQKTGTRLRMLAAS